MVKFPIERVGHKKNEIHSIFINNPDLTQSQHATHPEIADIKSDQQITMAATIGSSSTQALPSMATQEVQGGMDELLPLVKQLTDPEQVRTVCFIKNVISWETTAGCSAPSNALEFD
jgi:hypothetical protein